MESCGVVEGRSEVSGPVDCDPPQTVSDPLLGHDAAFYVFTLPLLEWCEIPAGIVTVEEMNPNGHPNRKPYFVDAFGVSKESVGQIASVSTIESWRAWWRFSTSDRSLLPSPP